MYKWLILIQIIYNLDLNSQNVGIGTNTPTLGKLEVSGVAGSGATSAAFGTDGAGISLQRSWPTIGFNQFRDIVTAGSQGKYMSNGTASILHLNPGNGAMTLDMFPTGTTNNFTPSAISNMTILNNGNIGVQGAAFSTCGLLVNRKFFNRKGSAVFKGSVLDALFHFGLNEDTYLSGGKQVSKLIINDIPDGKILHFGNTSSGYYEGISYLTYTPTLAKELWGSIATANSYSINVQQGQSITNPALSSYVKVFNTSANSSLQLTITNGNVDGQILIVEGNQNPFTIIAGGSSNIYGNTMTVGGGDVVTFIWSSNRVKWMRLSFQDN